MSEHEQRRFPHLPDQAWELLLREELPDASTRRLERHAAECAECRAVLEAADPSRLFGRLSTVPAPAGQWDGFWEGIQDALEGTGGTATPPPPATWRTRAAAVAGAACLVLALLAGRLLTPAAEPGPRASSTPPCPLEIAQALEPPLKRSECEALLSATFEEPPIVLIRSDLDLEEL